MQLKEKTRLVYITISINLLMELVWLMLSFQVIEYSLVLSVVSSTVRAIMWITLIIFFKAIHTKQEESYGKNV